MLVNHQHHRSIYQHRMIRSTWSSSEVGWPTKSCCVAFATTHVLIVKKCVCKCQVYIRVTVRYGQNVSAIEEPWLLEVSYRSSFDRCSCVVHWECQATNQPNSTNSPDFGAGVPNSKCTTSKCQGTNWHCMLERVSWWTNLWITCYYQPLFMGTLTISECIHFN